VKLSLPGSLGILAALESASSAAPGVDRLVLALVATSVLVAGILLVLNLTFIVRYRRGSSAPRPPARSSSGPIEAAWIAGTTVVFLGFFAWGAKLYLEEERAPAGAYDIAVVARQWMWDIHQPNGRREFNELHVPLHTPIRLLLTSEDVIHSFYVPAFRLKQDVVPGKTVSLWFNATKAGRYAILCSEFCGSKHAEMTGVIVAEEPEQYAAWLTAGAEGAGGAADQGRQLFTRYGCAGCHEPGSTVRAPLLEGIYGRPVPVAGGGVVRADEAYLRDSILLPNKIIVAGYQPVMPSFQGIIPEGDLLELVAFLKTLGAAAPAGEGAAP
jgi:cytochrome c oxidase subunit 2